MLVDTDVSEKMKILGLLALVFSTGCLAGDIGERIPSKINPQDKFVFYSHGYIVEGENPKPVDTRFGWGLYDFPAIKQALASDGYHLIARHRAKNTDPFIYATELSQDIRTLIKAGVLARNITIVGFSRGAFITGLTSNALFDVGVNTVILAGCGRLISKDHEDVQVYGHVLSIYEKSDRAGSCQKLKDKSPNVLSFKEIEINTGLEHGAFYRPIPEWINPLRQWMGQPRH